MTHIGESAFRSCLKLKITSNNAKLQDIGVLSFYLCQHMESIILSEDIDLIREGAFSFCEKLRLINLGDKIKLIQQMAFFSCGDLEEIYIPDSVEEIEVKAFGKCKKLEKISLPEGIKLGEHAFLGCKGVPFYREVHFI